MSLKKIITPRIISLLLLLLIAGAVASPIMPDFSIAGKNIGKTLRDLKINLGLDLKGGAHLVYRADMSQIPEDQRDDSLSGVRDVIEKRVNTLGVSEPEILTNKSGDEYRLIVDMAGIQDTKTAIAAIGKTPTLDFREEKTEDDYALTPDEKIQVREFNKMQEEKARDVLAKALDSGQNFEDLAREFSQDPSAVENSGDLGFAKKGQFVPEFENVIFDENFQSGTVWPQPVKSQFGYHIIKKTEERGEGEEKEVQASHVLIQTRDENLRPETEPYPFKRTTLTGKQLERAQVVFEPNTQEPQVALRFNEEGKQLFKEITERNLGKRVAIFLDGEPISIPTVQTVITDGEAIITGSATLAEAKELAKELNAGALPVPIELVSQETVGASLGAQSLRQSLKAGIWGLIVVACFMVIYYLFFGLVAIFSLAFYTVLITAVFKLLGITLTLSGIAGFILSIGMAVDANILIFERIKEELKEGKATGDALRNGFERAWSSIRDGNISTLITCVILAGLGTGTVKGFAITLGIGVALSMFTAVYISRNILFFLKNILNDKLIWGFRRPSLTKAKK